MLLYKVEVTMRLGRKSTALQNDGQGNILDDSHSFVVTRRNLVEHAEDQSCRRARIATDKVVTPRTTSLLCARAAKALATYCVDRASRVTLGT